MDLTLRNIVLKFVLEKETNTSNKETLYGLNIRYEMKTLLHTDSTQCNNTLSHVTKQWKHSHSCPLGGMEGNLVFGEIKGE